MIGMEGLEGLVRRATDNAQRNGLADRCRFTCADLFKITASDLAALGRIDRMLIDPPRDGAIELTKALTVNAPLRVVYVSCNPATLARDAAILTQVQGYRLTAAGVINMFPHTTHIESIAQFERG